MSDSIVIVPDIHGRVFWKDVVGDGENDIIFLGDYLDPYPNEHISREDAIGNFLEIIDFKRSHMDSVTLLLGNHDFMEYICSGMGRCRTDMKNRDMIGKIFLDNWELFQVGKYMKIGDMSYSFSHAPILSRWMDIVRLGNDIYGVIDTLNDFWKEGMVNELCTVLNYIGSERGGYDVCGSPIWADVRELLYSGSSIPSGVYQIFGHTQLLSDPIISDCWACLDCRKGFILKDNKIDLYK